MTCLTGPAPKLYEGEHVRVGLAAVFPPPTPANRVIEASKNRKVIYDRILSVTLAYYNKSYADSIRLFLPGKFFLLGNYNKLKELYP